MVITLTITITIRCYDMVMTTAEKSEKIKAGIAAKKAAGTYTGGKPKKCATCGEHHKVGNPCGHKPALETIVASNPVSPGVTPPPASPLD